MADDDLILPPHLQREYRRSKSKIAMKATIDKLQAMLDEKLPNPDNGDLIVLVWLAAFNLAAREHRREACYAAINDAYEHAKKGETADQAAGTTALIADKKSSN